MSDKKQSKAQMKRVIEVATGRQEADLCITGAQILDVYNKEWFDADLLIADGIICGYAKSGEGVGTEVVDAKGKYLLPGFIDAHTHFDLDVCNTTTADDFYTGSRAALRGGTTTVIDFACPNKGESLHYGLDLWHKKADGRTFCDYGFHMTIDDWNEEIEREIDDMYAAGISSFKMYMTYPAMMIGDEAMYKALPRGRGNPPPCGWEARRHSGRRGNSPHYNTRCRPAPDTAGKSPHTLSAPDGGQR